MKAGSALALLALAALFVTRNARASTGADAGAHYIDDWGDWWGPVDPVNTEGDMPASASADARVNAFLDMIAAAETTPQALNDGVAFRLFYGMSTFNDFRDHPTVTGEKRGIVLPDEWCRKAGFGPGCVSTAAGAWQITQSTWNQVRQSGIWGPYLPDFSPESQREAARRVLILAGALDYVKAGDFDAALQYASKRWASLAGSTAGQGTRPYGQLLGWYQNGLENYA